MRTVPTTLDKGGRSADARAILAGVLGWQCAVIAAPYQLRFGALLVITAMLVLDPQRIGKSRQIMPAGMSGILIIVTVTGVLRLLTSPSIAALAAWAAYAASIIAAMMLVAWMLRRVSVPEIQGAVRWWLERVTCRESGLLAAVLNATIAFLPDVRHAYSHARSAVRLRVPNRTTGKGTFRTGAELTKLRWQVAGTIRALWTLPDDRANAILLRCGGLHIPTAPFAPLRPPAVIFAALPWAVLVIFALYQGGLLWR